MRHPTNGLNEDDLSRLTGSSSSSSSSSTDSTPSHENINQQHHHHHHQCSLIAIVDPNTDSKSISNLKTTEPFNSTYLPEIIDPLEWQKSRKRKERLDSTSSTTQDRKLIRSNSEELLPNPPDHDHDEVIRRVASHEDFQKKPLQEVNRDENILRTIHENENNLKDQQHHEEYYPCRYKHQPNNNVFYKDMAKTTRLDTSPARSHRVSPNRNGNNKYKENDDSECEHEKRRSSERFCKSRAPPGRKSGNYKKSSKYSSKYRERDENVYKYDIAAMKQERRGFVSKFKMEERTRKEEAADGEQIHDYNDNNLIDFHLKNDYMDLGSIAVSSAMHHQPTSQPQIALPPSPGLPPPISTPPPNHTAATYRIETVAEALPWDSSVQEDQTPVLCRRFAPFDEYGTDARAKIAAVPPAVVVNEASKCPYRSFTKSENFKTRSIMQDLAVSTGHFQLPEERLKWVNKRLTALKKRVIQLEENFERTYGYRPSQVDKYKDKQIKTVLAEISKLRKEKHDLKADPISALGLKVNGGMDAEKKLAKMKETLKEIEMKLTEKRKDGNWSENLDNLNAEQLVLEKTALQHSLLYFESLYGRPTTREERDVVRSLYDRYRIIKRLVTRSLSIAGTMSGIPELPTILEHEAMAFTVESMHQPTSVDSTDTASSPDHPQPPTIRLSMTPATHSSDSLSDSGSNQSAADSSSEMQTSSSNPQSETAENIHTMSVDELWEQLEKVREEKKELKRVINEFEAMFEVQSGRKMLKSDRKTIEDTYFQYKQKKAKVRLLQALIKKQISK